MPAIAHPLFERPLRFVHRVNSQAALARFLATNAGAAEGDIRWGVHPASGRRRPALVMAHPPRRRSDLRLDEWIDALADAGRVLKLDVKDPAALEPAIALLAGRVPAERVIINADVLRGPSGKRPRFGPGDLEKLSDGLPGAVVSIGATTRPWSRRYKPAHIDAFIALAAAARCAITCALRQSLVDAAPHTIQPLVDAGLHITIWNSARFNPADAATHERLRRRWPDAWLDLSYAS